MKQLTGETKFYGYLNGVPVFLNDSLPKDEVWFYPVGNMPPTGIPSQIVNLQTRQCFRLSPFLGSYPKPGILDPRWLGVVFTKVKQFGRALLKKFKLK